MAYFTPVEIEVLMFYRYGTEDHPRISTPSIMRAIDVWISRGMMDSDTKRITEKGDALIKMMCNTPSPVERWVDPRGDE